MKTTYRINEIFYSLQGEGRWTGTPVNFVRFSGCNLTCDFCDTEHQQYKEYTVDDIINEINKSVQCNNLVLTGGEPYLQVDKSLMQTLMSCSTVAVETNGTIEIEPSLVPDWLTVSPKNFETWHQRAGNELKLVYQGQTQADLDRYYKEGHFDEYYLQPCSMSNIDETIKVIKRDNRWKLSLQTQKILKIR